MRLLMMTCVFGAHFLVSWALFVLSAFDGFGLLFKSPGDGSQLFDWLFMFLTMPFSLILLLTPSIEAGHTPTIVWTVLFASSCFWAYATSRPWRQVPRHS